MSEAKYDVLGIGNAIVDVIAMTDEAFLADQGLAKGSMALIDEARAEALYDLMGPAVEASGGSAANTLAGLGSLGARVAFVGKVKDDTLGRVFRHDITTIGVDYGTVAATDGVATARCFVLVTPDGERTMSTYLGAAQALQADDIDAEAIRASKIVYLEGYLWDPPAAKEAFRKAASIAHEAGRMVALSLSDSFCVDRYRDEFLALLRGGEVDLLLANDSELKALYQTGDIEAAIEAVSVDAKLAAVTLGAEGCVVIQGAERTRVPAAPVDGAIVDKTGAGDLFAAGFLYGYVNDLGLKRAGELGSLAAAEVISHVGARPLVSLKALAEQRGLV